MELSQIFQQIGGVTSPASDILYNHSIPVLEAFGWQRTPYLMANRYKTGSEWLDPKGNKHFEIRDLMPPHWNPLLHLGGAVRLAQDSGFQPEIDFNKGRIRIFGSDGEVRGTVSPFFCPCISLTWLVLRAVGKV